MKVIKKTAEVTILERRDGRYAVRNAERQFLHGEDKIKVLAAEGLVKPAAPGKPKPAADAPEESSGDNDDPPEA